MAHLEIQNWQHELKPITTGNEIYDNCLKHYFADYRCLTEQNVRDYMKSIKHLAPSTQALHKCALKAAIKTQAKSIADRLILDAIFSDIKTPKPDPSIKPDEIITNDEYKKMLYWANNDRDRLIIQTLYTTGLRVSELCGIKITDCTINGDTVNIDIIGKGQKERGILLPKELYQMIRQTYNGEQLLFETTHGNPYKRQYIYRIVKRAGKRATGRDNIHPHTLRHSFATHALIEHKRSLKAVSRYLGHSTTAITADFYIHDDLTIDDIRRIGGSQ